MFTSRRLLLGCVELAIHHQSLLLLALLLTSLLLGTNTLVTWVQNSIRTVQL